MHVHLFAGIVNCSIAGVEAWFATLREDRMCTVCSPFCVGLPRVVSLVHETAKHFVKGNVLFFLPAPHIAQLHLYL